MGVESIDELQTELTDQVIELVAEFIDDGLPGNDALTALADASRRTKALHCEPLPRQQDVY